MNIAQSKVAKNNFLYIYVLSVTEHPITITKGKQKAVIGLIPAGAGNAEAHRLALEIAARNSVLEMSGNSKPEVIKRFLLKSISKWLKPSLLERPKTAQ